MTDLPVRRLAIDLDTPFPVRWAGGDAFRSALFNALSMSFPVGEQFFIDSVRAGIAALPPERREAFAAEAKGFIGQEATHRHVHARFNAILADQGQVNTVEARAGRRMAAAASLDVRNRVAATAATEHLTAVFAEWTLRHPEAFDGVEPRLRRMWEWHAAEESEHRSTAFDLYGALGGDHAWRVRTFRYVTTTFVIDIGRQTLRNLWDDGALLRPSTWTSAARFLFSRDGFVRGNVAAWRAYLAPDFHPSRHGGALGARWLDEHPDAYSVVGRPAA
ncbi:MAG TPA: metal-dependent hydrolase [Burkholderiaceae bacterium]|nr:metal-dependent hydrolase [Burkholderiaceae bacterium]